MLSIRVAILDMNNNVPNKGLGYIKSLVANYHQINEYEVFDVRYKGELPDDSFDIYISSGGPGSPYEMDGVWDKKYFGLINQIAEHNQTNTERKKYFFFICHSFQLACMHWKVGTINQRNIMSFGIYPIFKTEDGTKDSIFKKLPEPFYTADFRNWQVIQADEEHLSKQGIQILAIEHFRAEFPDERAIMAIAFTPEMIGTQFHPEADAEGMLEYLTGDERRFKIIEEYGEEKYKSMLAHLHDPNKLATTYKVILPTFMQQCFDSLQTTSNLIPA